MTILENTINGGEELPRLCSIGISSGKKVILGKLIGRQRLVMIHAGCHNQRTACQYQKDIFVIFHTSEVLKIKAYTCKETFLDR